MSAPDDIGLSGRIAARFYRTEITPLLALTGLLLGLFAVGITPREEEPQIDVTFANIFIPFPGASAEEVESLLTTPAEQIVSEIRGVKHVYSASTPGMAALTVRFKVGEPRTEAIVRLYNAFYSNQDWIPPNVGVGMPLIKPKGIDDVPIVAGTLWSKDSTITAADLLRIANTMKVELQRVKGTRDIEVIGGPDRVVQVLFDPQRMASHQLSLTDLRNALSSANHSVDAGSLVTDNQSILVQAGTFLMTSAEVADLVVGVHDGAPVLLRDIAEVREAVDQPRRYVTFGDGTGERFPAVTLSISKKPGENAVDVASQVIERFEQMRGIYFPDGIEGTVTRNYGTTAADKAQTLINKLLFATLSVIALVLLTLGRREAIVVGAAVIVTLALTLFASWAWGFTLNRVSLFALIFSIGILVDDAIVVVENIHRHMQLGQRSLSEAIPIAVDEVGGPTILATFTVIAALLPMAFVSGLMGPYMRPIPINASTGMLISLGVAFIFTPWLYHRLFINAEHKNHNEKDNDSLSASGQSHHEESNQIIHRFFSRVMTPFLRAREGRKSRLLLLGGLIGLILLSCVLVVTGAVIMKMLPFDNKSEFQVMLDMPEGTPLETTHGVLQQLADAIETVPEVTDYQLYAGTSAPINFNGLVRQYYLRTEPHQGDIQVNLADKSERDRQSHEIASGIRNQLAGIGKAHGASVRVVEVPPGPPVLAPLVAEIYGLDYARQIDLAG
ncbi:MAG: efflux RND transporter permease subunit, partial [Gammaproteobacteria bacterium]|nr:efflux RND transporter permease subunit [Gammaproteobacteria bacterium]